MDIGKYFSSSKKKKKKGQKKNKVKTLRPLKLIQLREEMNIEMLPNDLDQSYCIRNPKARKED